MEFGKTTTATAPSLELFLSEGFCSDGVSVYTANDHTLLFTISNPPIFTVGEKRVLRDARSVPLFCTRRKAFSFKEKVKVYRGESEEEVSLVFSVKFASLFSRNLHIFLAGSSLDGPPDFKLKTSSTFSNSLQIFQQENLVATAKKHSFKCVCCFSQPDYRITIAPGMDQAMVVLLIVLHEDLPPKWSGGGGGGGCG